MSDFPCLVRSVSPSGEICYSLGDPLVDRYLAFVGGRCRANTLRAAAFDLKTFFTIVRNDPVEVRPLDLFEFLIAQRGDRTVVRISDRESGLSARTIARRLSSVSGFYAYLIARGDTAVTVNPVLRGLSTRNRSGSRRSTLAPLVRVPRTLPTILLPVEVDRLITALRTHRDRAMVLATVAAASAGSTVTGIGMVVGCHHTEADLCALRRWHEEQSRTDRTAIHRGTAWVAARVEIRPADRLAVLADHHAASAMVESRRYSGSAEIHRWGRGGTCVRTASADGPIQHRQKRRRCCRPTHLPLTRLIG